MSKSHLAHELEEKSILNEICNETNHHNILDFKLGNKSLKQILSKTKPFEKKFFYYQRYNFKLHDLTQEYSFHDIEMQNQNLKKENNDEIKEESLTSFDEKKTKEKFNNIFAEKKSNISEILNNMMEEVNIFDVLLNPENSNNQNIKEENNEKKINIEEYKEDKKDEKEKIKLKPIEMVDKIENEYNKLLVEKIKSETPLSELYPLDTFKKNNELTVELLSEQEKNFQFQILKENMSIKELENNTEEKDIFTYFTADKINQEPGSFEPRYIYAGTNKGKIVKIKLNNKNTLKDVENFDTCSLKDEGITCIDVYDKYMVTGHQKGLISFWENCKSYDSTRNISSQKKGGSEIVCLKIIKINSKKKKIEIIFSDILGNVFYLNRYKGLFKNTETKELLLFYVNCPIYKITFWCHEQNLTKTKKKLMLFSLTSSKGVTLLKIRPKLKPEKKGDAEYLLKHIDSPNKSTEGGIFDSTFGLGFSPMELNDIINGKGSNIRGSISESIVIGKNTNERLFLAVSFGYIINLYDIKISLSKNKMHISGIGHYINDKNIIHISFLTNSYMSLISNDFYLKIINTFDFDKDVYRKPHAPTKNNLINYENIELKKLIMIKQTNLYKYNEKNNTCNSYYIYLNSIIDLNKSILILGRQNLYQYTLLQWDAIIESFDRKKQYEKMLWLTMVVFNSNKNLLTIQSKNRNEEFLRNNKYQICSPIISKFLIQVVMKEIKNKNFTPLRMFIEFCIGSELYDCLYESIYPLSQMGYDCFLYQNLTKYILNDDCSLIEFKNNFLISYIKYYVEMREKNILSEILFHINVHLLLDDKSLLSYIKEIKLVNPLIYIQINTREDGKTNYFKPIEFMYNIFHEGFQKEKEGKLLLESDKTIKDEYNKLIIDNDLKYYNEDISLYHEFIGHKVLWYCNKTLNKEIFHINAEISNNSFIIIAKKILFFLTRKEIMEEFMEFDSYSYFEIISRYYLENDLFEIIQNNDDIKEENLYKELKDFIEKYSKEKINLIDLSAKFFFDEIEKAVENMDNIYIKYDFYTMVTTILKKNEEFILDKNTIKNTIIFFVNYLFDLKEKKSIDKYKCHKNSEIENIDKKIITEKKEVENILMFLVRLFDDEDDTYIEEIKEILKVQNIAKYRNIRMHLYESSQQYEEYFKLYKEEIDIKKDEKDKNDFTKSEKIKIFFGWINNVLSITSYDKEKHINFKKFLLTNFNYLSDLSLKDLSNLAETWFPGEEEDIILALKDSESQTLTLQFKYINYYFATHECDYETIKEGDTYYEYLILKIKLLIKADYKEQILNLLFRNNFLCNNEKLLEILLKEEVYDAVVLMYYTLDKLKLGINIVKSQLEKILEEIDYIINLDKYISTDFDSLINNLKKYIELGMGICQKGSKADAENYLEIVEDYWLKIINPIYLFQVEFVKDLEKNLNNYKTTDYIKINNSLDDIFELILSRMTDYIPLKIISEVMTKNCGSAGSKKFKNVNRMMFIEFRLRETIFDLSKKLLEYETSKKYEEFMYEYNRGYNTYIDKCIICEKKFELSNLEKIIYFKCNHSFHDLCFFEKKYDINICPICSKKKIDIIQYEERDIKNYVSMIDFKKNKDEEKDGEKNEIIEEKEKNIDDLRKEIEKHNKIKSRKQKLLQLKRIRKKKEEIASALDNQFLED
jgi:hypothetical protein